MVEKLKRKFQQKLELRITIDFVSIEFKDVSATTDNSVKYCICFDRGRAEKHQTAWKSIKEGKFQIEYQNERFTRKSGFYFNKQEVQEKKGTIKVIMMKEGKESEITKQDLDLSGLLSASMKTQDIVFKTESQVTKVTISAQVYPEPGADKDIETVDEYLLQHEQKEIMTEHQKGLLGKVVGGTAHVLFTPVRAAKNAFNAP